MYIYTYICIHTHVGSNKTLLLDYTYHVNKHCSELYNKLNYLLCEYYYCITHAHITTLIHCFSAVMFLHITYYDLRRRAPEAGRQIPSMP